MSLLGTLSPTNCPADEFFLGLSDRPGDLITDVEVGVGEEALTFSRAVGAGDKVIGIEAHPRTYRCLEKLLPYNRLENVILIYQAVTETWRTAIIEDSDAYLSNRLNPAKGIAVPATTADAIHQKLRSGPDSLPENEYRISKKPSDLQFEALRETRRGAVHLVSRFSGGGEGDVALKTKSAVKRFLGDNGFHIVERLEPEPEFPPYIRDQVRGYNIRFNQMRRPAS